MLSNVDEPYNYEEPEEIASASHSIQSAIASILKPPFWDGDIDFASNKIFGDDGIKKYFNDNIDMQAGTNLQRYRNLSAFRRTLFSYHRVVLQLLFRLYEYWLIFFDINHEIRMIFSRFIWGFIVLLGIFPTDINENNYTRSHFSDSINSSTISLKSVENTNQFITNYFNITFLEYYYSKLMNLPLVLGNYALYKSTEGLSPADKYTIIKSIGHIIPPKNTAIIFEMTPLVIPMPPDVPTPYLTAEKKLVVPDPKETSKVLSIRAEWSASHHAHKATENLRVCSEAARVVSWSVYLGLNVITIYEKHGSAWKSLDRLESMIMTEISNLNNGVMDSTVWVKLVDVSTGETLIIDHNNELGDFEVPSAKNKTLNELDLTKIEASPMSNLPETGILVNHSVHHQLTVFLINKGYTISSDNGLSSIIREQLGIDTTSNVSENVPSFDHPDIILKYGTERSNTSSLNGFLMYSSLNDPAGSHQFDFFSRSGPASFSHFVRSIRRGAHNRAAN